MNWSMVGAGIVGFALGLIAAGVVWLVLRTKKV
jgi:hypothetical protein